MTDGGKAFLNKIEQSEIVQGIDYEGKSAEWQRQN
jgi:hypothetical protein